MKLLATNGQSDFSFDYSWSFCLWSLRLQSLCSCLKGGRWGSSLPFMAPAWLFGIPERLNLRQRDLRASLISIVVAMMFPRWSFDKPLALCTFLFFDETHGWSWHLTVVGYDCLHQTRGTKVGRQLEGVATCTNVRMFWFKESLFSRYTFQARVRHTDCLLLTFGRTDFTTQWSRSSSAFLVSPVHFGAVVLSPLLLRESLTEFFSRLLPAEQFHFWWRPHLVFSPFGWFANRTEISSGLSLLRLVRYYYDPEVEVLWGESRHENRRRNFWRHLWRDLVEFT